MDDYNYVSQDADGNFIVVVNGSQIGTYSNQGEAEQAFNAAMSGGGGGLPAPAPLGQTGQQGTIDPRLLSGALTLGSLKSSEQNNILTAAANYMQQLGYMVTPADIKAALGGGALPTGGIPTLAAQQLQLNRENALRSFGLSEEQIAEDRRQFDLMQALRERQQGFSEANTISEYLANPRNLIQGMLLAGGPPTGSGAGILPMQGQGSEPNSIPQRSTRDIIIGQPGGQRGALPPPPFPMGGGPGQGLTYPPDTYTGRPVGSGGQLMGVEAFVNPMKISTVDQLRQSILNYLGGRPADWNSIFNGYLTNDKNGLLYEDKGAGYLSNDLAQQFIDAHPYIKEWTDANVADWSPAGRVKAWIAGDLAGLANTGGSNNPAALQDLLNLMHSRDNQPITTPDQLLAMYPDVKRKIIQDMGSPEGSSEWPATRFLRLWFKNQNPNNPDPNALDAFRIMAQMPGQVGFDQREYPQLWAKIGQNPLIRGNPLIEGRPPPPGMPTVPGTRSPYNESFGGGYSGLVNSVSNFLQGTPFYKNLVGNSPLTNTVGGNMPFIQGYQLPVRQTLADIQSQSPRVPMIGGLASFAGMFPENFFGQFEQRLPQGSLAPLTQFR